MDSDKNTYASSRMWNEIGFGRNSLSNDSWKCKHAPLGVVANHPCFSVCVLSSIPVIVLICLDIYLNCTLHCLTNRVELMVLQWFDTQRLLKLIKCKS